MLINLSVSFPSFKVRVIVANSINLLGGAADYLLDSLQIIQNQASRFVTRRGRYTPRYELPHKTTMGKAPQSIYSKHSSEFPNNTRLDESEILRMGVPSKTRDQKKRFMHMATSTYSLLPAHLRKVRNIHDFKLKVNTWATENCII